MTTGEIQANGFRHWILGAADLAEPVSMPTHLPYVFSAPDGQDRVPFPDVVLASGYTWATNPANGYHFHTSSNNALYLSDEDAVSRCMLRPYMHATYSAQRFIEQSDSNPNEGRINTGHWRQSVARYLLKESGIEVSWNGDPPEIRVARTLNSGKSSAASWDMANVNLYNDGRAKALALEEQSPLAILRVFSQLRTTTWSQRLLKIDE